MATFVKGDYVQVCPYADWKWDQWSVENTRLCGKTCKVVSMDYQQWTNQLFINVEHRGKRVWFLDHHLIKVENYEEVFQEGIHEAAHQLNETERICKKLRDEILSDVFGTDDNSEDKKDELFEDTLEEDWENATTKEVIPLPGNAGVMKNIPDPKTAANENRKKIRKIKSIGKKMAKKQNPSGSLADAWSLSDEELEDLQDYLDSLPYSNPNSAGDVDYYYDFDDWGDGNGD
jgi:hypothetical protein